MPVVVNCRGCGKSFGAPDSLVGKTVKCPQCSQRITVEAGASPASPPAASPSPARQKRNQPTAPKQPSGGATTPRPKQQRPSGQTPTARKPAGTPAAATPVNQDPLDLGDLASLEASQDPLGLGSAGGPSSTGSGGPGRSAPPARPMSGGWQKPSPRPAKAGAFPWLIVLGLGGGGLALLLILAIVIVAIVAFSGGGNAEVADRDRIPGIEQPLAGGGADGPRVESPFGQGQFGTPAPGDSSNSGVPAGGPFGSEGPTENRPTGGDSASGNQSPADPAGEPEDDPTPTETTNVAGSDSTERRSLVRATLDWHNSPSEKLGRFKVEGEDLVIYHYSWLTRLLPELGHQAIYDKFNFEESFNVGANVILCRVVIPEFLNPLNSKDRFKGRYFEEMGLTHFVGLSGYAPTRNSLPAEWSRSHENAGVFGYDEIAKPSQISDGTSNTMMVVGTGMMAGPWVAGGGNSIKHAQEPFFDTVTGLGSVGLERRGVIVMMADGSVRYIYDDIDPSLFKALCTIRGGEAVDRAAAGEAKADWSKLPRVPPAQD